MPYLIFAYTSLTDAGALHLATIVKAHKMPDQLLAYLPPVKAGALGLQQWAPPLVFENLELGWGNCRGVIYVPNDGLGNLGKRILEMAEILREHSTELESDDEDQTVSTPSKAGGTNRRVSDANSLTIPTEGPGPQANAATRDRQLKKRQESDFDRARNKVVCEVLRKFGIQSVELYSVALKMLVLARAMLLKSEPKALNEKPSEDKPFEEKPSEEKACEEKTTDEKASEEERSGKIECEEKENEGKSSVEMPPKQDEFDVITSDESFPANERAMVQAVAGERNADAGLVVSGCGPISYRDVLTNSTSPVRTAPPRYQLASPPPVQHVARPAPALLADQLATRIADRLANQIAAEPDDPSPGCADQDLRYINKSVRTTPAKSKENQKDERGLFGVNHQLWARIIGYAAECDGILSFAQQKRIVKYASDQKMLAREMDVAGKPQDQQIWRVLQDMGCLSYEGRN